MLDLTDPNKWEVKLPDGTILKVKMPTIARYEQVAAVNMYIASDCTLEEKQEVIYLVLESIFNDNVNGRTFSRNDIKALLQPKHTTLILKDYMDYCINLRKK